MSNPEIDSAAAEKKEAMQLVALSSKLKLAIAKSHAVDDIEILAQMFGLDLGKTRLRRGPASSTRKAANQFIFYVTVLP